MAIRLSCRIFLFVLVGMLIAPALVRADDTETREFSVFVDGKESGSSRMTLVQKDDGTSYMTGSLNVKFRQILGEFSFAVETQEWWKNGRLIGMKTSAVDNGKKTDITVAVDNNQLRMRVNGKESAVNPETWTTSFWKLADARFHNKQTPILEIDTGREFNTELKYVGTEKLKLPDLQDCYRFKVAAAPSPVDLWYDRFHRLVRLEFTEAGHRTIVQLTKISR
jgi:hypothetical protein